MLRAMDGCFLIVFLALETLFALETSSGIQSSCFHTDYGTMRVRQGMNNELLPTRQICPCCSGNRYTQMDSYSIRISLLRFSFPEKSSPELEFNLSVQGRSFVFNSAPVPDYCKARQDYLLQISSRLPGTL